MKRDIEVDIKITPTELATEFCEMDSHEQAKFFNMIGKLSEKWDRAFCFQMQNVIDSEILDKDGLGIMRTIGEYSNT